MSDVLVSYKREDEARVAPIVEGLVNAGLAVWWDRATPGGARWRQTIIDHLDAARCVVVVWSQASVGPAGDFVQEEAGRAKSRGVFLPVRIDRVSPPLGFGEVQVLDLVRWRGNARDVRFQDVVAAAQAIIAGGPRPRPKAPAQRLRRATAFTVGLVAIATFLGFVGDVAGLQAGVCRIPGIRTGCASLGLGGVPTRAEESAWNARRPGDCAVLRDYLARFPKGAYAEESARRLQAAESRYEERLTREERRLPLTVRPTLTALENERVARADALTRAPEDARRVCDGFNAGGNRLVSAAADVQSWRCSLRDGGIVCGFDGQALCQVEVTHIDSRQFCP